MNLWFPLWNVVPGNLMWILVCQCRSWNSSVDAAIPDQTLGFQCGFCDFFVDVEFPVFRVSWDSSVYPGFPVWIPIFQREYWDSSMDIWIPVLILGNQYGFRDSSVDAGQILLIAMWILVLQYGS